LRGRVGRGEHKSYCVLISDAPPPEAIRAMQARAGNEDEGAEEESSWTRLLVLEQSQDGFFISEEDLKMRGPGDFFGTKQSGSPTFQLADLARDAAVLELARQEAHRIFAEDPKLENPEHTAFRRYFDAAIVGAAEVLKSG